MMDTGRLFVTPEEELGQSFPMEMLLVSRAHALVALLGGTAPAQQGEPSVLSDDHFVAGLVEDVS